eukprot:TRINITY_DN11547_c0_g1_i7.p4 TRINITY_DN11547_c0_g1~~TRINITY_DN11547_c0_g1_i7.p4  ORF type:complete len:123 (+),score=3.58 TRINITY_DN11547_c0_g1_i7:1396-1764(+)
MKIVEMTQLLLRFGADPNGQGMDTYLPLHTLLDQNLSYDGLTRIWPCFELLLNAGADPFLMDIKGKTAFHYLDCHPAARYEKACVRCSPAISSHLRVMSLCLANHGPVAAVMLVDRGHHCPH